LRKVGKEIVIEQQRNSPEQLCIYRRTFEDIIDIGPVAAQVVGKPFDRSAFWLAIKYFFYMSTDMNQPARRMPARSQQTYKYKKARNDVQFISLQASPNALYRNKQSSPTPYRYIYPLAGAWIDGKQGAFVTAFSSGRWKLAIS